MFLPQKKQKGTALKKKFKEDKKVNMIIHATIAAFWSAFIKKTFASFAVNKRRNPEIS